MPKLPVLKPKQIIKVLEKLGFVFYKSKGSHMSYYNSLTNKQTVVPFHNKDIPKGTLLAILDQAGISKEELSRLL